MFLLGALFLIGALAFVGLTKEGSLSARNLAEWGFLAVILVLAFRGGRMALRLAKGCVALLSVIWLILLLAVLEHFRRKGALPVVPTLSNTLPAAASVVALVFCVWVLFFSASVRAYLERRRNDRLEREKAAILRPGSPDSGPQAGG